ncbi:MAG: multiheme c-type cytochrome [Kofleriaceae bacterium]
MRGGWLGWTRGVIVATAVTAAAGVVGGRVPRPGPVAAHAAPAMPAEPRATPHRAWYRLGDLFPRYGGPVDPGPPPRGLASVAPSECATCHAEIAAEWRSSAHARAFTNAVFRSEYALTPERFCVQCHAPLAPSSHADRGDLQERGVDCAVCHVRDGHVLGTRGAGDAEHAARRDPRLRASAFCGSCHQFDFPELEDPRAQRYHPRRPLQDTLAEWRRSAFARTPCQSCHMPQVAEAEQGERGTRGGKPRRHVSHAFSTLDDRELLARALRVRGAVRRRGAALEVTLELVPDRLGHAFPTGDMFRQGELIVRLGRATHRVTLQRIFAQTITADARGHLLGQVDDTRVLPGQRWRRRFRFDTAAAAHEVTWTLTLLRLEPDEARRRGLPDELVRVPIASGALAVPSR